MPYVKERDFDKVRHLMDPTMQSDESGLRKMEADIYALNRQIRALPGHGPTPEWQFAMEVHMRMLAAYRAAGGKRL